MPDSKGFKVSISMFFGAELVGEKSNRRSQTGVLICMKKDSIHWYRKRQATCEAITFGEEFCDMKTSVNMVKAIHYKLLMFGVPIDGYANVFCDK